MTYLHPDFLKLNINKSTLGYCLAKNHVFKRLAYCGKLSSSEVGPHKFCEDWLERVLRRIGNISSSVSFIHWTSRFFDRIRYIQCRCILMAQNYFLPFSWILTWSQGLRCLRGWAESLWYKFDLSWENCSFTLILYMLLWMDLRLSSTTGRLDLSLLEINNCDAENPLSHEVVLYARKDKLM